VHMSIDDFTVETVAVDGSPMEVFVCAPPTPGPHPGIVLAQHIPIGHTGVEKDQFTLDTALRYASNGFVVAVPFIFHWWPKGADIQLKRDESRDERMGADMQAAFASLAARDDVDANRIGVVGHCWGGRVAWLAACTNAQLSACVMFYGGRVQLPMGEDNPPAIVRAPDIHCPVAGFYGNDDTNPTRADVDDYSAALTAAGVAHEFHRYDGVGHAFQNSLNSESYRPEQSEDAWAKSVAFLSKHLSA
jgi:carboxymethylenebutenolidase